MDSGVTNVVLSFMLIADSKATSVEEYPVDDRCEQDGGADPEVIEKIEKDEVVNCICQINEENGLMIQVSLLLIQLGDLLITVLLC